MTNSEADTMLESDNTELSQFLTLDPQQDSNSLYRAGTPSTPGCSEDTEVSLDTQVRNITKPKHQNESSILLDHAEAESRGQLSDSEMLVHVDTHVSTVIEDSEAFMGRIGPSLQDLNEPQLIGETLEVVQRGNQLHSTVAICSHTDYPHTDLGQSLDKRISILNSGSTVSSIQDVSEGPQQDRDGPDLDLIASTTEAIMGDHLLNGTIVSQSTNSIFTTDAGSAISSIRAHRGNETNTGGSVKQRQEALARRMIRQSPNNTSRQNLEQRFLAGATSILGSLKLPKGGPSRKEIEEKDRRMTTEPVNILKGPVMIRNGAPSANTLASRDKDEWMDIDSFDETEEDNQIQEQIKALRQIKRPSMENTIDLQRLIQQVRMKARRARVDDSSESRSPQSNTLFLPESENEHRRRQRMPRVLDMDEIEDDHLFDLEDQNERQKRAEESEGEVEENLRRAYDETAVAEKELSNTQSSNDDRFHDDEQREEMLRQAAIYDAAGSRRKRKRVATTSRGLRPKNAREAHEIRNQELQEAATCTETFDSQTQQKSATPWKGKGKSKPNTPKRPAQRRRPKVKPPKLHIEAEMEEYASVFLKLMTDDAVADRAGHGEVGPAPKLTERQNKTRALKELMASVPKDFKRHVTNDKKVLLKASKMFGHGKVKLVEGKWLLKGMNHAMFHHQLLGVDWMVARECGQSRPYGGLLADTMGLGKTMQILATIVGNPPNARDGDTGTTLIVMPSTIIEQWKSEIDRFLPDSISSPVVHYKSNMDLKADFVRCAKILLTSYNEVCTSYPYPDAQRLKTFTAKETRDWIGQNFDAKKGILHQMDFYRVVLDEAHAIKNFKCRTSLACQSLKAKYRWAVTATPIMNKIEEFFPYFRFLRMEQVQDIKNFRKNFCNAKDPECGQRVNAFLSFAMIRRTHKDKMFNRPIIDIPLCEKNALERLTFSPVERVLYDILECRCRALLNRHLKVGDPRRSYTFIMVLFLRLRQCTTHPMLLRKTIRDVFTLEDLRLLERKIRDIPESQQQYREFQSWIREANDSVPENSVEGVSEDHMRMSKTFGNSAFGTTVRYPFGKYLATLDQNALLGRSVCMDCGEIADHAQITSCDHVFCKDCLESLLNDQALINEDDYLQCPSCNSLLSSITPFQALEADSKGATPESSYTSENETTAKGKRRQWKRVKLEPWLDIEGDPLPSTKTVAMKDAVLRMLAKDPTDKIVIYTQFLLVVKIISRILNAENIGHVYYTGELDQNERHESVTKFHDRPEIRVMIAGLKCGGLGLNLTCACRVISLDLWWNHTIERQAFGRVFRIGQTKKTTFLRLAIKNTVDDRLIHMQAAKIRIVDSAMWDGDRPPERLSLDELASLFGYVECDENGKRHIYADFEEAQAAQEAQDEAEENEHEDGDSEE